MDGVLKFTSVPKKLDLKELDFFSEGVGLKMGGEDRVKSYLGMFTSLCLYTLLGLATFYYLQQFLDESSPKIQYNRMIKPQASSFTVNEMGAFYFFLIGNPSSKLKPATESDGVTTGERRRILQTTKPPNLYLTRAELEKYFVVSLSQEIIQFQTNPSGGEDYQIVQAAPKTLIPCSEAEWFIQEKFQDSLKENEFVQQLIKKYGICMKLDDSVKIFGDQLSRKSSRLRFKLDFCDSTTKASCLPDGFDDILKADGLNLVVGSFEPSVDNSNKTNPWSFALNVDTQVNIEALSVATVTVSMKSMECLTDMGMIISDVENQTRAAIDMVKKDFTASFEFGSDITADLSTPPAVDQYTVQYIPSAMTYVDVRFVASRTTEQFQRTYDTVLDLFGNIGGSLDFVIIIFVILFNWMENILTDRAMFNVIGEALQVPDKISGKSKKGGCCKKRNRTAPTSTDSLQKPKVEGYKDALSEVTDKALSIENLTIQATTCEFMIDNMVPAHLRTLMPLAVLMKKIVDQKREEEKKKSQKPTGAGTSKLASEYNVASTKDITNLGEQTEEKLSVAEAFDSLDARVNPMFENLNREVKKVFTEFASSFGIQDMRGYLKDEESLGDPTNAEQTRQIGKIQEIDGGYKGQQSVELSNAHLAKLDREEPYTSLKKKTISEAIGGPNQRANLGNLINQN